MALGVIAWAPDTPLGKTLRNWLVEAPARVLNRLTPFKITVGLIVFVWLIGMVLAAPELIPIIGIGDLALYLDATVIVMLLGTAARLKLVLTQTVRLGQEIPGRLIARFKRSQSRSRSPRRHRHGTPPSPDDTASPAGWEFA
jgi:hypothetical protein